MPLLLNEQVKAGSTVEKDAANAPGNQRHLFMATKY